VNYSEDVTVATRDALEEMIAHLVAEYGYTHQQAYAICSVAVQLRVSSLPDVPNAAVTALLPLDIFE
jgi:formamidase